MTIAQMYENAKQQLDKGIITIGEFSAIVDREYQEPSKWVPCSERLPKENDNYFVTISFDIGGKEPVREVYKDFFSASSQKWLYHDEEVIAWMPLPESYKGNEIKTNDNDTDL